LNVIIDVIIFIIICRKDNLNRLETAHVCDILCSTVVRKMKSTGVMKMERDAM